MTCHILWLLQKWSRPIISRAGNQHLKVNYPKIPFLYIRDSYAPFGESEMASQIIRLTNVKLEGAGFCVLTPESFRTVEKPVLQIQDFKLNTDSVIAAQSHAFKLKYDVKLNIYLQGRSIMTIEDLSTVGGLMKRLIHHIRYM